jgi:hypothetical protein
MHPKENIMRYELQVYAAGRWQTMHTFAKPKLRVLALSRHLDHRVLDTLHGKVREVIVGPLGACYVGSWRKASE